MVQGGCYIKLSQHCDTFNSTLRESPFEISTNQILFVQAIMVASNRVGLVLLTATSMQMSN